MAAVTAPLPQQPSPVEIAGWNAGRGNARQQYLTSTAQNQYGRDTATLAHNTQQQQLAYNQGQQRQTFDDPYIARGIFNSGIRGGGLQNFYTTGANEAANYQQQYLASMGQYGLSDTLAALGQENTLQNIQSQEDARRNELAMQIKGII